MNPVVDAKQFHKFTLGNECSDYRNDQNDTCVSEFESVPLMRKQSKLQDESFPVNRGKEND